MTAIQQLATFYDNGDDFARDLHAHLLHGYCHITPTQLALARPVSSRWTLDEISNPEKVVEKTDLTCTPDCWYVWAAIGDMRHLLSLLPHPLPLIAFSRQRPGAAVQPIKFYPSRRFLK